MDTSRLLLIFMVITLYECSEIAESHCGDNDVESYNLLEGEAFYFVPLNLPNSDLPNEEFTWYKNNSQIEPISTEKKEMVHYRGGALFFLNLCTENSGFYTVRHKSPSGMCSNYHVKVEVFKAKTDKALFYGEIKNSDLNKKVSCPESVSYTCEVFNGNLTWKKDFKLLQGHSEADLWVYNTTKDHEGIYTCTCTWTYNHMVYNSSGSRRLRVKVRESPGPARSKNNGPSEEKRIPKTAVGIARMVLQSLKEIYHKRTHKRAQNVIKEQTHL